MHGKIEKIVGREEVDLLNVFYGQLVNEGREDRDKITYRKTQKTQEFIKVSRKQIKGYLAKRYSQVSVCKIMKAFRFPR